MLGHRREQHQHHAGNDAGVARQQQQAGLKPDRAQLSSIEPWIAGVVAAILTFPTIIWFDSTNPPWWPVVQSLFTIERLNTNVGDFFRMWGRIVGLHVGLVVLAALASGWKLRQRQRVPVFERAPIDPFARLFVYYHAIAPVLLASVISVAFGERGLYGGTAPLVVLSGLAVVVLAGDVIAVHRQRIVSVTWLSWLLAPPILAVLAILTLPWITGMDYVVSQPASSMGRFFSDTFTRRTGKPLEIVAGEPRLASLVALYSSPRARLYLDSAPEQSPWIKPDDIARKGAIVVWIATDAAGTPPAEIKARFPTLVPDVPRPFEQLVQGRTPLLRVGWGVVRPRDIAPPPAPSR